MRETEIEREKDRERMRETEVEREKERERGREILRERERDRGRDGLKRILSDENAKNVRAQEKKRIK